MALDMIDNPWEFFKTNDFRRLKIDLHPDKHGGTPEASAKFAQLIEAYELSQQPQPVICGKPALRELVKGDLRRVWRADGGVIKELTVKSSGAKSLVKKEHANLSLLQDKVYGKYFPEIEVLDGGSFERSDFRLYSLTSVMSNYPDGLPGRHIAWITRRFLVGLGWAHSKGIAHCAVYPEHMLVSKEHAGILTGWIHSEKIGAEIKIVSVSKRDWYTNKIATPQNDVRLLGKSLESMMGDVPVKIKRFIQSFQYTCPDCWILEKEFSDLLKSVYGDSKFVEINLEGLV